MKNAVLRLREQRLAASQRPFRARGSRLIRCPHCLLSQSHCLCDTITPQTSPVLFALLMYDTEPLKPSNTGRLIADILPETQAYLWSRTELDPKLLQLLERDDLQPYLVFPASYATADRVVTEVQATNDKRPLFILLDGTWSEARKMFRKSPYLATLPVLSLNLEMQSEYELREAQHPEQLCTVEVAIALLHQAQDWPAAKQLSEHFSRFKIHYLASKFNRTVESVTANPQRNA